jgi:type I restriction enzyme, S subunit
MSSEWESLTIGDLVQSGEALVQTGPFGSQLHSYDYVPEGTPVIPTEAIGRGRILDVQVPRIGLAKAEELSRHRLQYGDILFARRGAQATGLSAIVDSRFHGAVCGTGALLLRIQSARVSPSYLAWYLSSPTSYEWLRTHAVGAVMPNLNTEILKALPIHLPGLAEQEDLARFGDALEGRIALLRQTNATLEAIAQALFKSWFVDFDPVRVKMEGRAPEGIDEATAALFPAEFEESALGFIPKGWQVGHLSDVASLNEKTWSARRAPAKVAYIDLTSVKANAFEPTQRMNFHDAPSRARRELRAGDTLVGTVRPGNRSFGFVARAEEGLTGSTGFAVLSPRVAKAAAFIYFSATRDENIARLAALADGGAYPAVRPELVANTPCVLAPEPVMLAFDGIARALLDTISSNADRARTLADLRDTLLPRLISGRLRPPSAEVPAADLSPEGVTA